MNIVSAIHSAGTRRTKRNPSAHAAQHRLLCAALNRQQFVHVHRQHRHDHRRIADRINREAHRHAERRDQNAADPRPDDPRRVRQAGVERDRVRQLIAPHHLEDERLPARIVEDQHQPTHRRDRIGLRHRDDVRKRQHGNRAAAQRQRRLRRDQRHPVIQPIRDRPAEEAQQQVRPELPERQTPTANAECVNCNTSHAIAALCNHVPICERNCPEKYNR